MIPSTASNTIYNDAKLMENMSKNGRSTILDLCMYMYFCIEWLLHDDDDEFTNTLTYQYVCKHFVCTVELLIQTSVSWKRQLTGQ